jgi:tryptophan-rich sensory protein
MTPRALLSLGAFLGITFAVAGAGSVFTGLSLDSWYRDLAKPAWTPPNWIFGPVWTTLYAMIAVAGWIAWRRTPRAERRGVFGPYVAQLGLNLAWSGLFFGLRSPLLGLIGIVGLWATIAWASAGFWRVSRTAGVLLAPYLAWVTFAGALNAALWWLNR